MRVTVFGASGKVGRLVVEQALARGITVIAFTHSHNSFEASDQLIIKQGDIHNSDDIAQAVQGSDAVISCLGSWGTKTRDILTAAMRELIPIMTEQKISRIITLTGSGATEPGKPLSLSQKLLLKILAPFPVGKVFRDGMEHMNLLAASNLDWTTLRAPVMTNSGSDIYKLSSQPAKLFNTIPRKAVAKALLDQLASRENLRQAPVIYRAHK